MASGTGSQQSEIEHQDFLAIADLRSITAACGEL